MFPADPFKSSQLGLVSSDQLRIACGIQGSFEPMRNAGGACAGSVKVAHACVHTTQAHDCIASQADRRTRRCAGPIMRAFQISLTGRCRLKMLGCEESTPATRSRPKFSSGRSFTGLESRSVAASQQRFRPSPTGSYTGSVSNAPRLEASRHTHETRHATTERIIINTELRVCDAAAAKRDLSCACSHKSACTHCSLRGSGWTSWPKSRSGSAQFLPGNYGLDVQRFGGGNGRAWKQKDRLWFRRSHGLNLVRAHRLLARHWFPLSSV